MELKADRQNNQREAPKFLDRISVILSAFRAIHLFVDSLVMMTVHRHRQVTDGGDAIWPPITGSHGTEEKCIEAAQFWPVSNP